jgi:hypothetical protein
MILWWGFMGVCVLVYGCYDALFQAPERHARERAQAQWDRDHFNGWRLEQSYPSAGDVQHGLFYDKLEKRTCTTKSYPGYPACPAQTYYVDGKPQTTAPTYSQ